MADARAARSESARRGRHDVDDQSDRDYHYGATPQGKLDLRCISATSPCPAHRLRLTAGGAGYNQNGGRENAQVEAAMTVRVYGPHALRFQCTGDRRDAHRDTADPQHQPVGCPGSPRYPAARAPAPSNEQTAFVR